MIRTIRSAFKAAKFQEQSALTAIVWAADDLRGDAIAAGLDAGLPALLFANVRDLPLLLERAEYACKTPWYVFLKEGAIGDLIWQINHEAELNWY